VGWLLLAFGLSANASGVAEAYADYALLARPVTLPAARYVALYLPATGSRSCPKDRIDRQALEELARGRMPRPER
jgi:hypothetical protein